MKAATLSIVAHIFLCTLFNLGHEFDDVCDGIVRAVMSWCGSDAT